MKNLVQRKKFGVAWLAVSAVAAAAAVAGAGIAAAQGNAATQSGKASLENGVLTVEGTNAADRIAVGLQAGQPGILQVDFGDDGSADFNFQRNQITEIVVDAGNGGDAVRIDESNGVFADTIPTTIDGGNGNDRLVGGAGAETLLGGNGNDSLFGTAGAGTLNGGNGDDILAGGNGNETLIGGNGDDTIDGNRGNDASSMGNGDDTFIWDPGDGSDTIEGQNGTDTMLFNGAGVVDTVDISANGSHLKFHREPANITMDTHGVDRVIFNALGNADIVTVNDLTGTDVTDVDVDLAGTLGGTTGDGANDDVIVRGTDSVDTIDVSGDSSGVTVTGLVPTVNIFHSEASDRLDVNTLAGTDTVNFDGLAAGAIRLFVDGILVV
jgi:Ca2+-binding RTX toxin-like protein